MAIDPYAPCPCGSGKKLKFCCADLAADIEKIQGMIEGDQPRGALNHVDAVLAKHPGRESLLDLKVMLELTLDELDEAQKTIELFLAAAPQNPSAYAQLAVLTAAREGGRAAVTPLQHALSLIEKDMPRRVLEAIGSVGQALLVEGNIVAARAHLWLYQGITGQDDTRALQLLVRLNQSAGLPLMLRDHLYMHAAPEGHPGEADHDRAQWYASLGRWLLAAQTFDSICGLYPDQPTFKYNRGLVYGWLGDTEKFVAGMRAYAGAEGVDHEDAVEAEAIAQLLDPEQRDTPIDVVRVVHPITDEEALVSRLAGDARVAPYEVDPAEFADGDGPPPRSAYLLLDKPLPESGAEIQRDQVPSIVGFLSHFGRQTDRGERLEMVIDKDERFDERKALLAEVAGAALGPVDSEDRVGESNAAEQALSWRWHFPADTPPARRRELLSRQRRDAILERWPETPRAVLGGKTPREAAADPSLRIPLEAAVSLLEQGASNHKYADAFAELRGALGLPVPGPLEPAETDVERLPLGHATRLAIDKATDDQVVQLYRRAMLAGATAAIGHAAREVVRRPSVHQHVSPGEAYERLIAMEDDTPKAIALVDEARKMSDERGESNVVWDMLELELLVVEGEGERANDLLQHVRREHINEPGVAEQLYQLLYALGATPDKAPVDAAAPAPEEPQAVGAGGGKIWTPGDDAGGGTQKIWTPS